MSPRYLRKVNGSLVCREDGQPVTSHAAHVAQWHSLSPRPNPQGEPADMQPATVTYSDWTPSSGTRPRPMGRIVMTRGLWLALYAATHDRYPHLAAQCLATRDALPATADALGGSVSPDGADLTPSANPTEIGPQNDERTTT